MSEIKMELGADKSLVKLEDLGVGTIFTYGGQVTPIIKVDAEHVFDLLNKSKYKEKPKRTFHGYIELDAKLTPTQKA